MGALIGLLLATVGVDTTTGAYRSPLILFISLRHLQHPSFNWFVCFLPGLVNVADNFGKHRDKVSQKLELYSSYKEDLVAIFPTLIRSSVIGTIIGAIPGTGGDIASWVGLQRSQTLV